MVIPALVEGGFDVSEQVTLVRPRPNGRKHKADVIAKKGARHIIISMKWQQTSGTAEQKVPFEVMCLQDAVLHNSNPKFEKAYLVLGGNKWTLRDYYVSDQMGVYLAHDKVEVLVLEEFIARANKGEL
jgi:hypothetical protein